MRLRYLSFAYIPATAVQFYMKDGRVKNTLRKQFRYFIVSDMKDVNLSVNVFVQKDTDMIIFMETIE